jgi:hypothetical protein
MSVGATRRWIARAVFAWILLLGCAGSHPSNPLHAPSAAGVSALAGHGADRAGDPDDFGERNDASVVRDAAVNGGNSDPLAAHMIIGRSDPLLAPWFAFKAGYYDAEQVWLTNGAGEARQVPTGVPMPWPMSCPLGLSTDGYYEGAGRFGDLVSDPTGRYVLFDEALGCPGYAEGQSRVLAYDVTTGVTRVLLETSNPAQLEVSRDGIVVSVSHPPSQASPGNTPDQPAIELFTFFEGAFEPVPVPTTPTALHVSFTGRIERLGEHVLLLAYGFPPLERVGGTWQNSALFDQVDGFELDIAITARSGQRMCGKANKNNADGVREESVLWTLDADGRWQSKSIDPDTVARSCLWSPDETRVAFGASDLVFDADTFEPIAPPSSTRMSYLWAWGDELYGRTDDGQHIVRVDWSTLAAEQVPALADMPELCGTSDARSRSLWLEQPSDDRDVAIVKESCGCIDCDVSGSVAWNRAAGSLTVVEEPFGGHDVFDIAWPADRDAVVLSTQGGALPDNASREVRPARGSFFAIDAMGGVKTVGPLAGPVGVLHAPVALGPTAN